MIFDFILVTEIFFHDSLGCLNLLARRLLCLLLEPVEEYHKVAFIHTAEDPVDVSLVFHPYLKQAGYARDGLQVGLRYDIQCHDIDEYLVYLVDGLLTERPLEFLEVVTIDGDLPLKFLFHLSSCKVN